VPDTYIPHLGIFLHAGFNSDNSFSSAGSTHISAATSHYQDYRRIGIFLALLSTRRGFQKLWTVRGVMMMVPQQASSIKFNLKQQKLIQIGTYTHLLCGFTDPDALNLLLDLDP
jgi:hypothetical protein